MQIGLVLIEQSRAFGSFAGVGYRVAGDDHCLFSTGVSTKSKSERQTVG